MNKQTDNSTWHPGVSARLVMISGLLLAVASPALAKEHAAARFRGTGKSDPIRIENVRRSDGPSAGQSTITFNVAWNHSWRAAWEVSAEQTDGKVPLTLESWDAAWVFLKFRKRGDDSWSHAMLSTTAADHHAPAGAALQVGKTDDGKRCVGVFIHRAKAGHGPNDFQGVTLRWLHGKADPAAVELKVFALQMVYVPECAFWAGDGSTDPVRGQFSAGATARPFHIESERALTLGGDEGETLNNRDTAGMFLSSQDDFTRDVPARLTAEFPKGYQSFYCMRHEVTQQQYVEFLNTLSYAEQLRRTEKQGKDKAALQGPEAPAGTLVMKPVGVDGFQSGQYRSGIKIAVSGVAAVSEPLVIRRPNFVASGTIVRPGKPAVYETDAPHVASNFLRNDDGMAFAAWAGLRPMTELEFEKSSRGPLKPVPNEYAWGTDRIAGMNAMDSKGGRYVLQNAGNADEIVVWQGSHGPDDTHGNAPSMGTNDQLRGPLRVGLFATPTSDRVSAGASYWGILDLTGNVMERPVSVGSAAGRVFKGTHGEGGESPWAELFLGIRGGGLGEGGHYKGWGGNDLFRISNRYAASVPGLYGGIRHYIMGFRCVRTAPARPYE